MLVTNPKQYFEVLELFLRDFHKTFDLFYVDLRFDYITWGFGLEPGVGIPKSHPAYYVFLRIVRADLDKLYVFYKQGHFEETIKIFEKYKLKRYFGT